MLKTSLQTTSLLSVALTLLLLAGAAPWAIPASAAAPASAAKGTPADIFQQFLRVIYARDYRSAYQLVSAEDRKHKTEEEFLRENQPFSGVVLELTRKLAALIEFGKVQTELHGRKATVSVKVNLPDANAPLLQELFREFDDEQLAGLSKEEFKAIGKKLAAMKKQGALPMIEGEERTNLIREQGGWRIETNWGQAIRVHFRAVVKDGLPWEFQPVQETVLAKPGETLQALYRAKNLSDHFITAKARHRNEPKAWAQKYLEIVQCFCFIQQTLAPGAEVTLPLIFRVDLDTPSEVTEFRITYEFFPITTFPQP